MWEMLRIVLALTACYVAGTVAGRGFLPYRYGDPASKFKSDVDALASESLRLASPDGIRGTVTNLALDSSRQALDKIGVRR